MTVGNLEWLFEFRLSIFFSRLSSDLRELCLISLVTTIEYLKHSRGSTVSFTRITCDSEYSFDSAPESHSKCFMFSSLVSLFLSSLSIFLMLSLMSENGASREKRSASDFPCNMSCFSVTMTNVPPDKIVKAQ